MPDGNGSIAYRTVRFLLAKRKGFGERFRPSSQLLVPRLVSSPLTMAAVGQRRHTGKEISLPYLSQMLSRPVIDADGVEIGRINDLAIQAGEVFPRITSVAFRGPSKTPFMVSWRKYVSEYDGTRVVLNTASHNIRFSYLQPDELLLARDLLNKQIVDTQGLKVVRVNDLKISQSGKQLRLLGAEVGMLGILRSLTPRLEKTEGGDDTAPV